MTTYIYNMGLRFKSIAQQYPGHHALALADGSFLTYTGLDELSDHIASHILQAGLKVGDVVAIFADKHPITYATMIAALKIGTPYVVLDTESPLERLHKILERCQPSLLVSVKGDFAWNNVKQLAFDAINMAAAPLPKEAIERVIGATPAYLMFTSGSTGFPKGVTIAHASILNFCDWTRDTFGITPKDILSGANGLYFDNSVFDFSASLFNGACLTPVDRETVKQPKALAERVKHCTLWFSVPSLLIYLTTMKALTGTTWPHIRAIVFGGEGFSKAELRKLYSLYGRQATLWNVYGPTECTCICSAYPIGEKDFDDMESLAPLGFLAPNFAGLVMDESGKAEMPDGQTGELYLLGPQVALGYYNDPERTQAAFAPNPLQTKIAQPCYRTGDIVLRHPDTGYYHFAGRKDNQVKHMGYRIELEEIEAALAGMSEVAQPAVIYHRGTAQNGKIVAYYQPHATLDEQTVKNYLRELLPYYMIPQEIYAVEALPKNSNGKVDRKTLAQQYAQNQGNPHA